MQVKKKFIPVVVHDFQELYDSVEVFFIALQLSYLKFCVCVDLKLANTLVGLQSHASKYPCTWCEGTNALGKIKSL